MINALLTSVLSPSKRDEPTFVLGSSRLLRVTQIISLVASCHPLTTVMRVFITFIMIILKLMMIKLSVFLYNL